LKNDQLLISLSHLLFVSHSHSICSVCRDRLLLKLILSHLIDLVGLFL
jgi:hypothetical protein